MGSYKTRDKLVDAARERAWGWRVITDRQAVASGHFAGCDAAMQVVADDAETYRWAVQLEGTYTAHGVEAFAYLAMDNAEASAATLALAIHAERASEKLMREQEAEAEQMERSQVTDGFSDEERVKAERLAAEDFTDGEIHTSWVNLSAGSQLAYLEAARYDLRQDDRDEQDAMRRAAEAEQAHESGHS